MVKMKNIPTVSIITPTINQGGFIEETMKSVFDQEGDFNLDYLIIDGGSTDNTLEIIKKYAVLINERRYPIKCRGVRYRYISERDEGQADAINKGLKMATGDLCAWINSDDIYSQGAVLKAVSYFLEHPKIAFIYGDCFYSDESGTKRDYIKYPYEFSWKRLVKGGKGLLQPSVFIRRKAFEKVGLLDTRLHFTMDMDWFIRIARHFRGRYINFAFATSRLHSKSKTFDRFQPEYLAEIILVVSRYGGSQCFVKTFGSSVHCLTVHKKFSFSEAYRVLMHAVKSIPSAKDSSLCERDFLAGYQYGLLENLLCNFSSKRKSAFLKEGFSVFTCNPSFLISREGLSFLAKSFLPTQIFLTKTAGKMQ